MKDTLSFLTQSLLKKNKIAINGDELDFQIQSHPSYPSLHSITGVLDHFDIENLAIRIPVKETILTQLPTSFIAQLKTKNETNFALVIKKKSQYKIIFNNKNSKTISAQQFLKQFTGIIVAIEKEEEAPENKINLKNSVQILFGLTTILFIALFFSYQSTLFASIHFILSTLGISISFLIIQYDLGLSSKIIDSICSQESKTTNCNAVLNSKGATIFKIIKLSDASLIYFISISFTSLLLSLTNTSFNSLYALSLTALPVVIYSLYYQIKVSKNWCVLCLGIATILVFQASIFFCTNFNLSEINGNSILLISFSILLSTSIWLFISPELKLGKELKKIKIKSSKFKRNFDLFNTLLHQSKTIDTKIDNTSELILGNKNALLNIVVITNPFCGHCEAVHNLIESIINKYSHLLNITIRFNVNTNDTKNDGVLVSSRLLELFHTEGAHKTLDAMHDIYNNRNTTSWIYKWGICKEKSIYTSTLETEYNWCLKNNINFTPEILINGKSYPKAYDREDLIFFIEDLNEVFNKTKIPTKLEKVI